MSVFVRATTAAPVPGIHLNHKGQGIWDLEEWRWPKDGEAAQAVKEVGEGKARGRRGRRGSEQAAVEYVLKTSDVHEVPERERRFKGITDVLQV